MVYPTIIVRVAMTRNDQVVWRYRDFIAAFNSANTYGYTPVRYCTEPELVRAALTGVSVLVSRSLVEGLNQ